jgi:alanyl-tRNA synthetase
MPAKTSAEIRRDFLDFFAARGHRVVPSSPVFPQDDPTLLFTNAGMNQFKDVFLGSGRREYTRAVDTQKCIRVSGKHNDLEEVGHDTYHHTFFEMLGNWSFGDYFKADAIPWAWELLTRTWKLPRERLWVTVFGGDEKDGLPRDEDSARIWRESTDIDPAHVLFFGRKDNFWEMGDTGPCGPCTEIHIDRCGPHEFGVNPRDGADPRIGVNAGNERFIELWNNVFMEFNRQDDGKLVRLPAQHVDTGMGFERIVSVLQGKRSNYDTDVFTPIFARIGKLAGKRYGQGDEAVDVAFRVIADHVRAVTSAFADGALPSNVGRGYVLRRLIRRASRYGRQALALEDPFLWDVAPAVAETLGEVFPEIPRRMEHVQLLLRAEEEAFGKTLGRGLVKFEVVTNRLLEAGEKALSGPEAFELYATYGFPSDLVELMARERGLAVDPAGWETARKAHQRKSRSEGKFRQLLSAEQLAGLRSTASTYHDASNETLRTATRASAFFPGESGPDALVLERSPFYAEGGGQIGDAGHIRARDGSFAFQVADTQRIGEVIVHLGSAEGIFREGIEVQAEVDRERRERTRKNHTATHLLHKALKEVLGEHVGQQGSYVGPDRLRFDFSHPRAVSASELEEIERRVNARVYDNAPVKTTVEPLEAAKARGVVAMFGEKYGETVRVLDVGGWSLELCGGTHVRAAGDIGPFVIASESAIQAGVRRIEAVTGPEAVAHLQRQRRELLEASRALKTTPDELATRIEELQKKLKEAKKDAAKHSKSDLEQVLARARSALHEQEGLALGVVETELDLEGLRELAVRLRGASADLAAVLVGREGERVPWIVCVQGQGLARGLDARNGVAFLKQRLGGGGGGKSELCQGQGQDAAALPETLAFLSKELWAVLRGGPSAVRTR